MEYEKNNKNGVMSETYKQSSTHPNNMECTQIDPDNRLLWKKHKKNGC